VTTDKTSGEARKLVCDVCKQNEALGVASSALGPCSWAFCQQCLDAHAEPAVMIAATIEGCDGAENVAEWVHQITTWIDGRYVPFMEAAAMLPPLSNKDNTDD
jgi:hypothetical protein